MQALQQQIEAAWEQRADLSSTAIETLRPGVERALDLLERGELRVAAPDGDGGWQVNEWLKKAVLLYFRINGNRLMDGGANAAWDKLASQHGLTGKRVIAVESGGKTLYRLRATGNSAEICQKLKAAGDACAVVE